MKSTTYVECSVCGWWYAGIKPKGGDGSILVPRKHHVKRFSLPGRTYTTKEICKGSYQECTREMEKL